MRFLLRASLIAFIALGLGACGSTSETSSGGDPDAGSGGPVVILDGGGVIPAPPDGEKLCPAGVCNYQSSTGCPVDKPSCVPALTGSNTAVTSCQPAGPGQSGASCGAWSDCAAGYICAAGACRKLCCGGDWTGCASAAEHCIQTLELKGSGGSAVSTGAMLCFPVNTCDALNPSSCSAPGATCQIVDPTGATACFTEGTGGSLDPCPCKGGFLCVSGQCRRLCKAVEGGGDPSCQAGEGACVHFNRDPAGVGECTAAQ